VIFLSKHSGGKLMWVNQIINVVLENKIKDTFYEKALWVNEDLNISIQFSVGYTWGALELTSDQYELIDEMSYDENAYDTQYNAPSRYDIKVCERRLFVNQKHFFGTDFCKVSDPKDACAKPDKTTLEDMANLSWFGLNYNIETASTVDLFQSMSKNDWIFKGYSYLVDGEISVTKKSDYDYLWLEKAIDENNNQENIGGYKRRVEILNQMEDL